MDFALEINDIPRARNYLRNGMNINSDHYGVADAERRLNTAGDVREAKLGEDKLREQEARGKEAREQELMKQEELRQQEQIKKEPQSLIFNTDKQKLEQLKRKLRSNHKG